ncbi:hypothetical protein BLNAU_10679 [Blattamonas nauphoetae]|uniref:Uncharacterized protein n=1 Tax=Blattamonas nauphoetae TaxID=2049346 RepID=A0ABQ9XRU9_9EUKA|nr:hypothetical protein BLNAU_10679 [Blattamonas nauphoetae]
MQSRRNKIQSTKDLSEKLPASAMDRVKTNESDGNCGEVCEGANNRTTPTGNVEGIYRVDETNNACKLN